MVTCFGPLTHYILRLPFMHFKEQRPSSSQGVKEGHQDFMATLYISHKIYSLSWLLDVYFWRPLKRDYTIDFHPSNKETILKKPSNRWFFGDSELFILSEFITSVIEWFKDTISSRFSLLKPTLINLSKDQVLAVNNWLLLIKGLGWQK